MKLQLMRARALRFESLEIRCLLSANPGDFNANGVVDTADYVLWRKADPRADSNGDTLIDQTDYNAWRTNFGNTYTSSTISVSAKDVPSTIPDEGLVNSHVAVAPLVSINNVKIQINIDHPYDSDLQAYLISPANTRVQLFSGVGESGANFHGTTFDDDASTSILDGAAPFTGSFRPSQSLSAFEGENAHGTWTLEVSDHFQGDQGTLLSWTLMIDGDPIQASGANMTAVPKSIQTTTPAPVSFAAPSSALLPSGGLVQSKTQVSEQNPAGTQSTLQPKTADLLLSIHSFSQGDAERVKTAAIELHSASKEDSGLNDSIASDDLVAADYKPFEQI